MADDGRGFVQVVTGSALPKGVSWGCVPAVMFDVVLFDDEGVQPTLTIENGLCVDGTVDPVVPPLKTEKAAEDEKPPVKPSDVEGEAG